MPAQLTLDGRGVTHPVRIGRILNEQQRDVVRYMRLHETVRNAEIGMLIHQRNPGSCWQPNRSDRKHVGCCAGARTAGWGMLERLLARGIVERVARGRWRIVAPPDEIWLDPRGPSPADRDEIVRLYVDERLTQTQIAERTFWAQATISSVLSAADVRRRPRLNPWRRLGNEAILETTSLYARGYSAREVGLMLGITEDAVLYRLRQYARDGLRHGKAAHGIPRERRNRASAVREAA